MKCPACHTLVVYHAGDRLKIRTRMIAITSDDHVEVVCKKCGADIRVDLQPGASLIEKLSSPQKRLVIKKSPPNP